MTTDDGYYSECQPYDCDQIVLEHRATPAVTIRGCFATSPGVPVPAVCAVECPSTGRTASRCTAPTCRGRPSVTSAYDDYPIDAIEVRSELVARAAAEGWWSYFTHDPGALPIRIEATEKGGFRAAPVMGRLAAVLLLLAGGCGVSEPITSD